MPKWIHDRAEHILAKNPSMETGTAFAIATQQAHKLGKTPKGFGTSEGKSDARKKYQGKRSDYVRGANPGKLNSPKLAAGKLERYLPWYGAAGLGAAGTLAAKRLGPLGQIGGALAGTALGVHGGEAVGKRLDKMAAFVDEVTVLCGLRKIAQEWGDWGEASLEGGSFKQESYIPPFKNPRLRTKKSFAVSQYSGPLGYGGFKQESYIPPFRQPPVKTAGPPSAKGSLKEKRAYDPSPVGNVDVPGMRKMRTPARGLQASKGVAQLNEMPPGPSIAQIAKPKGLGQPMAGATKATSSSASFRM